MSTLKTLMDFGFFCAICAGVSFLMFYTIMAYIEPDSVAPSQNTAGALSVSSENQAKLGNLGLTSAIVGSSDWARLSFSSSSSMNNPFYEATGNPNNRSHFLLNFFDTPSTKKPLIELNASIWAAEPNSSLDADNFNKVVAEGYVQGKRGVCAGAACVATWPSGQCADGTYLKGLDANGNLVCNSI